MAVFRTLNSKIETTNYTIDIKNMDVSSEHFASEKYFVNWFNQVENFLYDKETLNKSILKHCLKLMEDNFRVSNVSFYRSPENILIMLITSQVKKLKDFPIFSREVSATFKKDNFKFSIVEILEEEVRKGYEIPQDWKIDEYLTNKIHKLMEYA